MDGILPSNPPAPEDLLRAGEIVFEFMRASGPGGQNVNKVSSAVRLRFNLEGSNLLPKGVKRRLAALSGRRRTAEGWLVVEARRFRDQERNRQDALERLGAMIGSAWKPPRNRRPTSPTAASRERRLKAKRAKSRIKRERRYLESHEG